MAVKRKFFTIECQQINVLTIAAIFNLGKKH